MPSGAISSIFTANSGALRANPHSHAIRLIIAAILPPTPISAVDIKSAPKFEMPIGSQNVNADEADLQGPAM